MPKYLLTLSFTPEGAKGILEEGGSPRRVVAENLASSVGGRLETFYFAFGKDDVYALMDLPDDASAASVSLTIAATGAARVSTTLLLTPDEIDAAVREHPQYRPPGG
jgi:uncharacterized protein with GYD domain